MVIARAVFDLLESIKALRGSVNTQVLDANVYRTTLHIEKCSVINFRTHDEALLLSRRQKINPLSSLSALCFVHSYSASQ